MLPIFNGYVRGISNVYSNVNSNVTGELLLKVLLPIAKKIAEIVIHYFGLIKQSFCCGIGLTELAKGALFYNYNPKQADQRSLRYKLHQIISKKFEKVWSKPYMHFIHGSLYLGAGICGTVDSLHNLGKVKIDEAYPIVNKLSHGLFIFANIVAIQQCIQQYQAAVETLSKASLDDSSLEQTKRLRDAAIIGVFSGLSYILASGLALFGFHTTLALICACIATTTGGLKFVCLHQKKIKDLLNAKLLSSTVSKKIA